MKKKTKFAIISILVILIINIMVLYEISLSKRINHYGFEKPEELESVDFTEVRDNQVMTQKFVGKYENLNKITVRFSDVFSNPKVIHQKVILGVKDLQTGEVLNEQEVLVSHIRIEKDYALNFKMQKDSKGRDYEIYLKYIDLKDEELVYTIRYYDENVYEESNLKIDDKETNFDLDFQDIYLDKEKVSHLYIILGILDVVIFAIAYYIYQDKKITPEKVFLEVLPVFAILLCLTITMGNGKDEASHLYRAYEISEGTFITKILRGSAVTKIPKSLRDVPYYRLESYKNLATMIDSTIEGEKIYMHINSSAVYSPVQYIPHATGIALAKLFTNSPVIITYVGRIFNMIVCIAVLYFAIKLTPVGKNIFLVLSILPITVSGIATLSADGLTTSMCFLFIAYILRLAFKQEVRVRKRDLVLLGILTIFISLCKIVYLPLIGLLLIIPKEKWGGRTDKIIKIASLWVLGIISSFMWLSIASGVLSIDRNGDSMIKLAIILENPFRYIQTILYTIPYQIEGYINSMFGGDIEYDSILIFHLIPYILMFLTIAVTFMDRKIKEIKMSKFQKIIIILVCLAIIFLIFTSLYMQWTEYGVNYVKGVQGRYFIPFLPLIFILFGRIKFEGKYTEEFATKLVGIVGIMMQIYVIMLVILNHI